MASDVSPTQHLSALTQAHPALTWFSQALAQVAPNAQAWLVGGCVRDALLHPTLPQLAHDVDLVLVGPTPQGASSLAQAVANHLCQQPPPPHWPHGWPHWRVRQVVLDGAWGIYRLLGFEANASPNASPNAAEPLWCLDVSNALNNTLADDLARRDLTLNAMAFALQEEEAPHPRLADPHGGQAALQTGRIEALSLANLQEDPLRLLRVFRFAATLGSPLGAAEAFSIEPNTLAWVQQNAALLATVAMERCLAEWLKLLAAPHAAPHVQAMQHTGLLQALFPSLPQPLLALGVNTLAQVEALLAQPPCALPPLPPLRLAELKWAALLAHATPTQAAEALQRLKCSHATTQWVVQVLQALPHAPLQQGDALLPPRPEGLAWLRAAGAPDEATVLGVLVLQAALVASGGGGLLVAWWGFWAAEAEVLAAPPLLSGQRVMALLGLCAGPAVGAWLARLHVAQQEHRWHTPAEAETWLLGQPALT